MNTLLDIAYKSQYDPDAAVSRNDCGPACLAMLLNALGTAVTNRTISFGAQPFFPPGINGSSPGPFFDLYHFDRAHPCSNGRQPANANQNGIPSLTISSVET